MLPNASLPPPRVGHDETETLLQRALQEHDEGAFGRALDRLYPAMLRLAQSHVDSLATAEEVVQETWLAALEGFARFEGRSTIRTWLFHILRNIARGRGRRDARMRPLSSLQGPDTQRSDLLEAVVGGRTAAASHSPAALWTGGTDPEQELLARELAERIEAAFATLPARQREVIVLRDVEGWTAAEVCNVLGLSDTNQRVILHRARDRVRNELREYIASDDTCRDEHHGALH